ncbi:hypothetical protein AQUCO_07700030v1 [Aquilegia coerulea]|uniref:Cytochrome P450 n=1 Tax=Aquilegia coerulea TaxID=218851 RepID=A0A2G5C8A1_AQUCA|nr:hypothetical protein AQUCO_07700030v1 [Aquilegia coerulea]
MSYLALFFTLLSLLPIFLLIKIKRSSNSCRLPPGSLGIPVIGQTFGFLRAMKANRAEKWLQDRVDKNGAVSKLTLFGIPTVIIHGQAANKFTFTSDTLLSEQPKSFAKLVGKRNLLLLNGEDHRRVRGVIMPFLKPEVLKQYVGKMDGEIRNHIDVYWQSKQEVTVMPLMKILTFNVMSSLLFGLEPGARRETFLESFQYVLEGILAIPVNIPFTVFHRSKQASSRVKSMIIDLIHEKRLALEKKEVLPHQDLITSLLSIHGEGNEALFSEQEIVENVMLFMMAGYDTSSSLLTLMIRLLAIDPAVHAAVLEEQEEITKSKRSEEPITWEDLTKMKYTWRVALEVLRITPPVFGGMRKTLKDIEFGGYLIPKGWQVLWAANMTQMDESIFPDPSKFDPKRFENQASVPPYSFVAFGGGPRLCPGNEFARIEILVLMHYLVTGFTWKLSDKVNNFTRNPFPVPTKGLPIRIQRKSLL